MANEKTPFDQSLSSLRQTAESRTRSLLVDNVFAAFQYACDAGVGTVAEQLLDVYESLLLEERGAGRLSSEVVNETLLGARLQLAALRATQQTAPSSAAVRG